MATKMSGLGAATSFVDADIFHLRTAAGVDKKITGAELKDSFTASEIDIIDAGGRFTGTEIEAALQELAGSGRTTETVKANKDAIDAIVGSGVGAILLASQTIDGGVVPGNPVWFNVTKEVVDLCDVADWTDDGSIIVTTIESSNVILSNALRLTKSGGGAASGDTDKTTLTQIDFTSKDLYLYLYIDHTSTLNKLADVDAITIRYGSDNAKYYQWTVDGVDLIVGWNTLGPFNTTNEDSTTGSPVIAEMDYIYIGITAYQASDTWAAGNLVMDHIFVSSENDWKLATNATPSPIGMYDGASVVILKGYTDGFSNLIPGQVYWMDENGGLVLTSGESYNNTKLGFSISDTEFLVDIVIESQNESITAGMGRGGIIKGFHMGGIAGAAVDVIEDLIFSDETSQVIAATLDTVRYGGIGVSSASKGYQMGGQVAVTDVIEDLIFSDETSQAIAAVLSDARGAGAGVYSALKGFLMGGTAATVATIDALVFAAETCGAIAATLDTAAYGQAGVSSPAKGYAMGSSAGAGTAIEDLIFADETSQVIAATMDTGGFFLSGVFSALKGYAMGGEAGGPTYYSKIEDLIFATETSQAIAATLDDTKSEICGVSSLSKGYGIGGWDGAKKTAIEELVFSTETSDAIAATLDTAKAFGAGVQY